ncbi:hypothetical protein GOODEAATRI_006539 [Goodea atripinnis]|uniref:Uncharacterized protein n=1 Tax=Goodea atripinnis TaxID=208336 RepID=A0ABV0MFJ9_9TELE
MALLCLDLIYDSEERDASKGGINDHDKNESKRSAHTFHLAVVCALTFLSSVSFVLSFSLSLSLSLYFIFHFQHGPYSLHSWPLTCYSGESGEIYFCSPQAI